jgi:hypothetical protein
MSQSIGRSLLAAILGLFVMYFLYQAVFFLLNFTPDLLETGLYSGVALSFPIGGVILGVLFLKDHRVHQMKGTGACWYVVRTMLHSSPRTWFNCFHEAVRSLLAAIALALAIYTPALGQTEFRVEKALLFALGAGSSVGIHEVSHYLMARVQGLEIHPHGLGWRTDRSTTAFQMAGLAANALSSELILLLPEDSRGSYFNGWLLTNILEQLTYSTLRYNDRRGDFGPLPPSKKRVFAVIFIAEALLATYRMRNAGHLSLSIWFSEKKARPMIGLGSFRQ